ncbi:MAG: hypothetical protein WA989_16675 [Henriciella sp.]|uniref:hypothetical protein n=1 Tax=Henriciella sp. TaxID=1968823 RepID=UPI003C7224C3
MKYLIASLVAAIAAPISQADTPKDLIGNWQADCDAWGTPALCEVSWSEGLTGDFVEIDYTITSASDGAPIFAGQGVYKIGETDLEGYWSDSGGAVHPLAATWENGTLTTHWGRAGHAQGRSKYELTDTGLRVTDWALTETGWQQFMQVDYSPAG